MKHSYTAGLGLFAGWMCCLGGLYWGILTPVIRKPVIKPISINQVYRLERNWYQLPDKTLSTMDDFPPVNEPSVATFVFTEHIWTADAKEREDLQAHGWKLEGPSW